ncbi:MAG: glycosyltransferase [Candidatus Bathyarchaeia archaeon]
MRIYFGVCGIGLGHVGRCIPIAKKLMDRGAEVLFSTYRDAVKYVVQEKLPLVEAPSIGFMVKPDGTVDFRQTVVNPGPFFASFTLMKQIEAEIEFIRAFKPDVIVSDSRVSPLLAAKILDIPDVCILNQFQIIIPRRKRFLRLAKLVDTGALAMIGKVWTSGAAHLMIPDFPPPYTLSAGNLRIPNSYQKRVQLIGPILPVHPHDLPSKEELRGELGLDEDLPLIFVPISGPVKERAYFTRVLMEIFKDFSDDYQVVMSLGYPNSSMKPIRYGNAIIYGWIPNRFEYLKACDLIISRVGHGTVTQAMCYGKPMILVPTPSHTEQLNNAKRVHELGIAEVLDQTTLDKTILVDAINKMLSDKRYLARVEKVRRLVSKLNGLDTAVETIMEVAVNSRKPLN